ncbi:MAG: acyl-CoA dehydratase activase-related protein [Bacillota bacterium]|nr:acyl-CoA dehydratase activase-related protein [Bacillota bacterium]
MLKTNMGIDIGSTTVKIVLLEDKKLIYQAYERHFSDMTNVLVRMITDCYKKLGNICCSISVTGSGGLSVSKWLSLPFIQEVVACQGAVQVFIPLADVVIELGGEDAKITYFKGPVEQRMNGSCAGGTGAFIDQMAALLNTDAKGLNEYAKKSKVIYPIASRCGVFAKTDIQPLINEGARKEDIAASIFQAVVNQTISGLACGKPIRGRVAFLGGPLFFLSELRKRFTMSLGNGCVESICPENSQLFTAMGAALLGQEKNYIKLEALYHKAQEIRDKKEDEIISLAPLFNNRQEYQDFKIRHEKARVEKGSICDYQGKAYLGIDAGSTTTKLVLIGEEGEILYSHYSKNEGNPLIKLVSILLDMYKQLPKDVTIASSTVTGYGEALMKAALHADYGVIETVAHYKAAEFFQPGVDLILDIGGQDMKCLRIKNNAIDSILLNEACSSGCGSFLESFASSLNIPVEKFAKLGLYAKAPVDLGTKCTVFMNSKVKQAQKEGVMISDLSAGLAYSVIKNALYKVIKLRNEKELGEKIVVQGGSFSNDALLRAIELILDRKVIRPEISGLMGAYGAALYSKDHEMDNKTSSLLTKDALIEFSMNTSSRRCDKCTNHCLLTINKFSNGESFISGNRCERGSGQEIRKEERLPNLYDYKYRRTFKYRPVSLSQARRGLIGIPRVLNMYENYPFWFTLLTSLGFRVILSPASSKNIYERGLETIPSESTCYPAKLCHGHIYSLIDQGVDTIFYPSVVYEKKEYKSAHNHYNCPVVISYPELIKNNIDEIKNGQVRFIAPFLSLDNEKVLAKRIVEEFRDYKVSIKEAREAVIAASKEREQYKKDIRNKGEEAFKLIKTNNKKGIILCGKPYHVDPEINHGIAELISSYGLAVLTEDSIGHIAEFDFNLRVVDQWTYNSRLYRAAYLASIEPSLELIQLNSFGCGLDAVTSDQISEILSSRGKMYTMLKIDEGNNLGPARIRIRSLLAAMEERERNGYSPMKDESSYNRPIFTKSMRSSHTILAPQMAPIHFELIREAARMSGYKLEVLPAMDKTAVDEGLKYVNNDACYPAIIMVGQIIQALKSGIYNPDTTSVIITQSGGGCRATNYLALIKLGLEQAGFPMVPIISVNTVGLEKQPGFRYSIGLLNRCLMALVYGDLFMRVLYRTRPYEQFPYSANILFRKWMEIAKDNVRDCSYRVFKSNIKAIIKDFDRLELKEIKKPRVAVVGEILLKYHPTANNDIVSIIEEEGAEAVVPDLMDYLLYSSYNARFRYQYLAGKKLNMRLGNIAGNYMEGFRKVMARELERSKRFHPPTPIGELADMASNILSLGNQTGEGWLVAAEMIEFIKQGAENIICVQPLACLPNHVAGKGMIKPIKDLYPFANIVPIDYDPGISTVNQLNRIKLMLSNAFRNIHK